MSDIRVNAFKDYRVDRNPKIARIVDSEVEKEWWNSDGWSTMYDVEVEEFRKKLPNADFLGSGGAINRAGSFMKTMNNTKSYQRLENVFNFIKKRDGYSNPMDSEKEIKEMMKPGVLYPGRQGFGFIRPGSNAPFFVPYPASRRHLESTGMEDHDSILNGGALYITDIKEGGVFVWNDALEAKYEDFGDGGRLVGDDII